MVGRLRESGLAEVGDAFVYGVLRRLFNAGVLTSYVVPSEEGPHRKQYSLNAPGRERLSTTAKTWRAFAETMDQLRELTAIYQVKSLSPETAQQVAIELTDRDALAAHVDVELGIDPDDLANPVQAALVSGIAFTLGALLRLLAILLSPPTWRLPVIVVSVLIALTFVGVTSARIGGSPTGRAGGDQGRHRSGGRTRTDLPHRVPVRHCHRMMHEQR